MEIRVDKKDRGRARRRADDLGAGLLGRLGLRATARVFKMARPLSGLRIKPSKCFASPVGAPFCEALAQKAKLLLADVCDDWRDFHTCDVLEYLGVLLGPGQGPADRAAAGA